MTARAKPDPETVLAEPVFAGGRSKPFAELTAEEVRSRADELRSATGWGPTARVASVARAWDYEGHRLINQIALASLPTNFPAFVFTPAAKERIAG